MPGEREAWDLAEHQTDDDPKMVRNLAPQDQKTFNRQGPDVYEGKEDEANFKLGRRLNPRKPTRSMGR
jgi:hypothetical protein